MTRYRVSALGKDGDTYEEVVDAADRFAAYRIFRERGDKAVSLREESSGGFSLSRLTGGLNGISTTEKTLLARNLAAMIEAGLSVPRALAVMDRQSRNPRLKAILSGLMADLKRGSPFSAALGKYEGVFSSLMVSMVRAGEESGTLAASLRVVATQMERSSALTNKIRSALIYPAIVISAIIAAGILMLIYVVPTLSATFESLHVELPLTTRIVIGASQALTQHTFLVFAVLILVILGIFALLKTRGGIAFADWATLHIPLIRGIVVDTNAARTARTLASLLAAGVDMVFAIVITRDVVGNSYFRRALSAAEESVTKGGTLSAAFAEYSDLYPPLLAEMIAVGEETGKVSELLRETAEFYEDSVDRATRDLSTVVEPLLMIVVGFAVGFFALAVLGPIYSLSNSIS